MRCSLPAPLIPVLNLSADAAAAAVTIPGVALQGIAAAAPITSGANHRILLLLPLYLTYLVKDNYHCYPHHSSYGTYCRSFAKHCESVVA